MNIAVGTSARRSRTSHTNTTKFSMFNSLSRIDECLELIKRTGTLGLTDSTAIIGLNLTHLMGVNVVLTSQEHTFSTIVRDQERMFTLTGCIIEDTFHNIVDPSHQKYLIALDHQLITNSDDLIETLYSHY